MPPEENSENGVEPEVNGDADAGTADAAAAEPPPEGQALLGDDPNAVI